MIPTIHLNGTGSKTLLEELETAHTAITEAIAAVQQITVHGRDYYVQGPHAYGQARTEMDARLTALEQVQRDLFNMHTALYDVQQGRTPLKVEGLCDGSTGREGGRS
jgi:hypothetical protein